MSVRDQRPRRGDAYRSAVRGVQPPVAPPPPDRGAEPVQPGSLRARLASARTPAAALLPLRLFAGITFVYAGFDKLIDPSFFDANSPASIYGQLAAFARVSPVAFLVKPSEPFALPIGLLIAFAEIAIGLGAITGLAFRLAAVGGTLLSLLFWLTASWATKPYYYGPDLPYAFGWATLALAGHGGLLVPAWVQRLGEPAEDDWPGAAAARRGWARRGATADGVSSQRRVIVQAGALGVLALAVYSIAAPARLVLGARRGDDAGARGETGTGDAGTGSTGALATPSAPATTPPNSPDASAPPSSAPLGGLAIAHVADVDKTGAKRFVVPTDAPPSLQPGDPGIIVKIGNGSYAAYDATCTHEGCRVGWDSADGVLLCPCHGAAFDPTDHGAVLGGPTNQPLLELPLQIDRTTGVISIKA